MTTLRRQDSVCDLPRPHRKNRKAMQRIQIPENRPPRRSVWPRLALGVLLLVGMAGAGLAVTQLREQLARLQQEQRESLQLLERAKRQHVRDLMHAATEWSAMPPVAAVRLRRVDAIAAMHGVGREEIQEATQKLPLPAKIPGGSEILLKRVTRDASVVRAQFLLRGMPEVLLPIDAAASVSLASPDLPSPLLYCVNRVRARFGDVSVAVVMDCSTSMQGPKIAAAQQAVFELIRRLPAGITVRLFRFSDQVTALTPWTIDEQVLTEAVEDLSANGSTVLLTATELAVAQLSQRSGQRHLLLCSDGEDSSGRTDIAAVMSAAREAQVRVHTIAIAGSDVDHDLLRRLSTTTGGVAHTADTPEALAGLFGEVSEQLSEAVYEVSILDPEQRLKTVTLSVSDQLTVEFTVPHVNR